MINLICFESDERMRDWTNKYLQFNYLMPYTKDPYFSCLADDPMTLLQISYFYFRDYSYDFLNGNLHVNVPYTDNIEFSKSIVDEEFMNTTMRDWLIESLKNLLFYIKFDSIYISYSSNDRAFFHSSIMNYKIFKMYKELEVE